MKKAIIALVTLGIIGLLCLRFFVLSDTDDYSSAVAVNDRQIMLLLQLRAS